jgi:hypothetical protein
MELLGQVSLIANLALGLYGAWQTVRNRRLSRQNMELGSRPALEISIMQNREKIRNDPGEVQRRFDDAKPGERFGGILVANKGNGPAALNTLCCEDQNATVPLEEANLPAGGSPLRLPCAGFLDVLLRSASRICYIQYTDLLGARYKQYFRINIDRMTAAPLRCEKEK